MDWHEYGDLAGFSYCNNCGGFLSDLPKRDKTADVAVAVAVAVKGEQPPWEGSWAKDGGGGWAIRLWMPDNDHREGEPREGDKVRITTKAGKVQALRLGERLGSSRRSATFNGPPKRDGRTTLQKGMPQAQRDGLVALLSR